jgi:hypothetical protein
MQYMARTLQRLGDWLYNFVTGKRFDNYTSWDHNSPIWSDVFYRSYGEAQWHKLHSRAMDAAADCVIAHLTFGHHDERLAAHLRRRHAAWSSTRLSCGRMQRNRTHFLEGLEAVRCAGCVESIMMCSRFGRSAARLGKSGRRRQAAPANEGVVECLVCGTQFLGASFCCRPCLMT